MFQKTLIVFLMFLLLAAAFAAGTSLPVLLLMLGLILIALFAPSEGEEPQE